MHIHKFILLSLILVLSGCASDRKGFEREPLAGLLEQAEYLHPCPVEKMSLDPGNIQSAFDKSDARLTEIYQKHLQHHSNLKGYIFLHIRLKSSGSVENVEILKTNLENNNLVQDTINFVQELQFTIDSKSNHRDFCYPIRFIPRRNPTNRWRETFFPLHLSGFTPQRPLNSGVSIHS